MEIFLLRHGHALSFASEDRLRDLSQQGRSDVAEILSQAGDELNSIEAVWYSPYIRTYQTQEIVRSHLTHLDDPKFQVNEGLVPDANYRLLYDWMAGLKEKSILLVTHQPLVGVLLDDFCGFESGRYRMGTSALAAIDAEVPAAGLGQLRWLKQPL